MNSAGHELLSCAYALAPEGPQNAPKQMAGTGQ